MTRTFTQSAYIELEVEVEYDFARGYPPRMYEANGDPGYPGEPDSLELVAVKVGGIDILAKLTPREREGLIDQLDEHMDDEPDYERDAA